MSSRSSTVSVSAPPCDREQMIAALAERYVDAQYVFVQFITEHLADCGRTFGGDLAQMLILAVIGQSHLSAVRGQPGDAVAYGVSALRIADVTGLPRETARRKLAKLAERGWIEHGVAGWRLAGPDAMHPQAKADLSDIDRRGLERLARLHADISRLLSRPPRGEA
jgi:hypothetical protein